MIDDRFALYGAFALRVTSGAFLLIHAGAKLFVFTPAGTAKFFETLGLPGPLAYLAIAIELIGGLALMLGVYARQVSILLAIHLAVATVLVHATNGFFFNNPNGGWEYPFFWTIVMVVQALIGEGAFAMRMSNGRVARSRQAPVATA